MAIGLLLAAGGQALADTTGANFESFALGDVHGQDGWTSGHGSSFCPLYDVEVVSNTYGYASFGARSLRISNAITCGSFNDQTFSRSLVDEAAETSADTSVYSGGTRQPYFEAQWDFASTVPGSEQPGLAVVASPDRGDPTRMSWLQMQDTPTGLQLNFQDYQRSVTNFVVTPVATGLDRTVPHTVRMTIQFIDGPSNDIVKVYLDGVLIHTGTTWEDYYRDFEVGVPHAVDSIMFRVAGTAAPANSGNGFLIDNVSTLSGPAPADSAHSTISPATATLTADGTSTQVITVQARDASNNNLTAGGSTVVISRASGTGSVGITTDNGNGTYTATVTSPTLAGSGTFTATLGGVTVGTAVGASSSVITFSAPPPAPADSAHSTISPATASMTANGTSTQVITVQARDASNNNLTAGGSTVVISRASGTGSVSITTDNGNGTYTATVTSPTLAGSGTFTATLGGVTVGTAVGASSSVITFSAPPPAPADSAHSTISPATASMTANGTSTQVITVQARDASNNNLATGGSTVVISRASGTGSVSITTDNGNGTYTATVTSPTVAGSGTFTATLGGVTVGTAVGASSSVITFSAPPPPPPAPADSAHSTISPATATLTADGTSTQVITVQARDASNNNLTAGGSTVVISRASGTGSVSITTDNGNGTYTATVTSPTVAGSGTFTATLGGVTVGTAVGASSSVITFVSGAGPPQPPGAVPVPTLTEWGMIILALLLAGVGSMNLPRGAGSKRARPA